MWKILITFILISINSYADESFMVDPYISIGGDNQLTLNFQTINNNKLAIEVKIKNKFSSVSENETTIEQYKGGVFQKVDLGKLGCDNELNYRIKSFNRAIDVANNFAAIPCNKNQPLYFGFMSDTQIKDPSGQKRAEKISQSINELKELYPFTVIVNAGDVVQHGGRIDDWTNYFKTAQPYLKNSYIFVAVGNHDYLESETFEKAPPQFRQFMRDEKSSDLGNAVLDLGRISVIMLNSSFDFMNEATYKEQWDWFIAQLEANQKINKPVLISMHHSPFSSSADWVREIPTKLRTELVPTLEKYSCVKMMLSGHLHMYERSQKGKIPYLVAGPSGGIINYITYNNPFKIFIKPFVTTFSVFKVTDKKIEVTTFTGQKEMIDNFSVDL